MDDLYVAIWQVECGICGGGPAVGLRTPSGYITSSGLCGPHFFGDKTMSDPDNWNQPQEATE